MKNLATKMVRVMSKIGRIKKNGRNEFHKYSYVTEADIIEGVRNLLTEEGIFLFSSVKSQTREGNLATVEMEFTLYDTESEEEIKSVYLGSGEDKGDKAIYKAYSGCMKYFLMKTFMIPTGDDPEGDEETDKRAYGQKPNAQGNPKPQNNPKKSDTVQHTNNNTAPALEPQNKGGDTTPNGLPIVRNESVKANDKQVYRLENRVLKACAERKGKTVEEIKSFILAEYGVGSFGELGKTTISLLMDKLEGKAAS